MSPRPDEARLRAFHLTARQRSPLMRYLIAALLLALVPMPVHAEPCDVPGYRLYTTGRVEFRTPGVDARYVGVRLPFLPGPAFATAVDDAGATNAWISAEVVAGAARGRLPAADCAQEPARR